MIKLRPEDITRYQFLSQLKMSPSGRHGVFSVSRANLTTNGYDNQLWTLDAQTEAVQALDGTQGAKAFCFLNDETICFTAEGTVEDKARVRRGELLSVVYTIPVSGGEAKILCRIPLRNVSVEALAGNRLLLSSFYDNRRILNRCRRMKRTRSSHSMRWKASGRYAPSPPSAATRAAW